MVKKKLICVFWACMITILFTACGDMVGVGEATVEAIEDGVATIEYMGQNYSWNDPDGALKYGVCTIGYKYKEGKEGTTIKIQTVEQKEELQHEKGDVRQVKFEAKPLSDTAVPLKIYADDFFAIVTYWGDSTAYKEDVILIDENGEEVYGWELSVPYTEYTIDLQWQDITGTAEISTGPAPLSDTSNNYTSSKNEHTCEVCSREGTHRYESFTGQIEYYCTEHYNEMMDMLKSFGMD